MVNWRQWMLDDLFKSIKSLPEYIDLVINEASDMHQRRSVYGCYGNNHPRWNS
jgi:hypothetical protein